MKRLITADVVRQECQAGTKRIEVSVADTIVTPEARTVAEQLGVEIVQASCLPNACCQKKETSSPARMNPVSSAVNSISHDTANNLLPAKLAAIRQAVLDRLPKGASVSSEAIAEMVKKVTGAQSAPSSSTSDNSSKSACPSGEGSFCSKTNKSGIKCVDGSSVKMGLFDGAGRENCVGCVDVVTSADKSSMGAGFMEWENCFFPWTLKYDEVDYVIDGELHIRCNGETTIGKAGDVIFIPKNSTIEFGTPSRVKFLFVAYPANWAEL